MKVMVIGGTGMVGSQVTRNLVDKGANVSVLTRDVENTSQLPDEIEPVVGNLLEPDTVRTIFDGMDAVFLLNAVSPSECSEALMAVNGALSAGVERITYLSVHKLDEALHLPHFGSKYPVEKALEQSGIEYTILRPNNFYQNDYWFKQALLDHGVYPQPIGSKGLSRVDVRDIAEVAALALLEKGHGRQCYNLVGPEILTGEQTAKIWEEALNREIQYAGNDLNAWEQEALQQMPDWMVYDFKLMYSFFQEEGLAADESDIQQLTNILGHPPRSFGDFAEETAASWL